ncbi:MAG: hypothetical protein AB1325_13480 [Nitrospirota bacterium]
MRTSNSLITSDFEMAVKSLIKNRKDARDYLNTIERSLNSVYQTIDEISVRKSLDENTTDEVKMLITPYLLLSVLSRLVQQTGGDK